MKISRTVPERKLDFIVLQLTDPQRDIGMRDKKGDPDIGVFWDKLGSISTPPEESNDPNSSVRGSLLSSHKLVKFSFTL